MPYAKFIDRDFHESSMRTILQARTIIQEYQEAGYSLTLRQLYYQFVSRGLCANEQREYNRLGDIIANGRLAGLIDWDAIEDRTRNIERQSRWTSPAAMLKSVSSQYHMDRWVGQPIRPELWVEKEALAGVFSDVCWELDIPLLACRGYPSWSEMWTAARERFTRYVDDGHDVLVLHFGDHDPSGVDMTRDLRDRLGMLLTGKPDTWCKQLEVRRVALNMDQVEEYDPPPNPAKVSDSRSTDYITKYGSSSWELDALEPSVLVELVWDQWNEIVEPDAWEDRDGQIENGKRLLKMASDNWPKIRRTLEGDDGGS